MKNEKKNNKRTIILSERGCEVIRNLIYDKIEELEIAKDNLGDSEYGVLYHMKIRLLESIAAKLESKDTE